jgi:hypothetical protein
MAHPSSITGLAARQLDELVGRLNHNTNGPRSRGRPWAASLRRRVIVACASLRTNLTLRELAAVFDLLKSQIPRIVADLVPLITALVAQSALGDRRRT